MVFNGLEKRLDYCEIHDFRRKIFKYRIFRVKIAPSRSPLVDVISKSRGCEGTGVSGIANPLQRARSARNVICRKKELDK